MFILYWNPYSNNLNMTQQEIVRRYLSDDQRYIRRCTIESKVLLYKILFWWKTLSNSESIGDTYNKSGNTILINITLGGNSYYLNADTKKTGVTTFLQNKDNHWNLILNDDGIRNKISNNITKKPIKGFYLYKKVH